MASQPVQTNFRRLLAEKEQRLNKRYSISEIARETKLTRATIYPWLKGEVTGANFETVMNICEFLECEAGDLITYTPLEEGQEPEVLIGSVT